LAAPRNTEIFRSHYADAKQKRNDENDQNSLKVIGIDYNILKAGVLTATDSGQEFIDYNLVFNRDTCELAFYDIPTGTLQYRSMGVG
jgi:hypothetical protein